MKKIISFLIVVFVSGMVFSQTDILPPQLVSPTNEDDDQVPDVTMNWYASAGIGNISYELQYDTSDQFANPFVVETTYTSGNGENLLFGTVYYWRVRAMDDGGTSEWSETFSFMTFENIKLYKPVDGDTTINPKAQLLWKTKISGTFITGITYYDYELSFDPEFGEIQIDGSHPFGSHAADTNYYFVWVNQLMFDTTYYWRVRARHDVDNSDWSEVWSFSTISSPTHVEPENESVDQMLDVTVSWVEVIGAFEYIYEICDDPNFASPCIFFADDNSITPMGLLFGKTYYWRVKAAHTADTSVWSEPWEFITLNTVFQTSPENGGYVDDLFPTLEWDEVTGITGFELVYSMNEDLSDAIIEHIDGTKTSHKVLYAMTYDETYYWKIRAYENGDTTQWSEVWTFNVGVSGVNDFLTDRTVNIYPNPATSDLYVEINAQKQDEITLSILNLLGQTIHSTSYDVAQGINNSKIDLSGLENGLYIIKLQAGENMYTEKIVIDR